MKGQCSMMKAYKISLVVGTIDVVKSSVFWAVTPFVVKTSAFPRNML